jgi:hypothetical protein
MRARVTARGWPSWCNSWVMALIPMRWRPLAGGKPSACSRRAMALARWPCSGELADPLAQLRVGAELVQAGDRADGLGVGGVPAGPADLHGHAFAGPRHGDGDLVHQGADELLAVGVGGGRRGPQAFDVAGEGGDGLLLGGSEGLGGGCG